MYIYIYIYIYIRMLSVKSNQYMIWYLLFNKSLHLSSIFAEKQQSQDSSSEEGIMGRSSDQEIKSEVPVERELLRCVSIYIQNNWLIGLVGRVFANGPADLGSIPGRVIPKTLKMVLDTSLLNTQQYKVRIKGKVEQSRERSSTLPYTWV